jgi:hypothetical protein
MRRFFRFFFSLFRPRKQDDFTALLLADLGLRR